jgi:transcriptional regulator with GAF, ATPase, and Fis domain
VAGDGLTKRDGGRDSVITTASSQLPMTPTTMADALTHYQALARLCRAAGSSRDLRSLIQEAAEALHELTGCDRVSLLVAAGPHGLAVEFDGKPRCEEIAAESVRASAAQGVFEQRQPRTILHNDPAGARLSRLRISAARLRGGSRRRPGAGQPSHHPAVGPAAPRRRE